MKKEFGWDERVAVRLDDVNQALTDTVVRTLAESKAYYLDYCDILLEKMKNNLDIKDVSDFVKVVELALRLQGDQVVHGPGVNFACLAAVIDVSLRNATE